VGLALPAGQPNIITLPQNSTVRNGGKTSLSVVATGRPPLSYQWLFNNSPINDPNAAKSILNLDPVSNSSAGSYSVVVTSGSDSITSDVAQLTVTAENQAPVAPIFKVTTSRNQSITISVSSILWKASDPDGDSIDFYFVDLTSSEGGIINDPGGATFSYTPPAGFTGVDQFTYNIKDALGAELTGVIEVEVVE